MTNTSDASVMPATKTPRSAASRFRERYEAAFLELAGTTTSPTPLPRSTSDASVTKANIPGSPASRFCERYEAALLELAGTTTSPAPPAARTTPEALGGRSRQASAWTEAVHIGSLRDQRAALGLKTSVRAIAKEAGISSGRAGDLLQARDAFPDSVVLMLGIRTDDDNDDPLRLLSERGAARLSRLSYRALRLVSRISGESARIAEVHRLARASVIRQKDP